MKQSIGSKGFKIVLVVIGVLILMVASFAAGMGAGFRKARYSYSWGENYERNFLGRGMMGGRGPVLPGQGLPGQGMMGGRGGFAGGPRMMERAFEGRDFRNAHGLAGAVVSVADNQLVVKDRLNNENTVTVTDKTIIKNGPNDVKLSDLKVGNQVVIMGNPGDNGTVQADLIRVFSAQ